jgi:hypothetical protein
MQFPTIISTSQAIFGNRPNRLFVPMLPAALPRFPDRCDLKDDVWPIPEQQQTANDRTLVPPRAIDHLQDAFSSKIESSLMQRT